MSRVEVEMEEVDLENDKGMLIPGVRATCSNCGHTTESFGQHDGSRKRCLALLREECPENEVNFYVEE